MAGTWKLTAEIAVAGEQHQPRYPERTLRDALDRIGGEKRKTGMPAVGEWRLPPQNEKTQRTKPLKATEKANAEKAKITNFFAAHAGKAFTFDDYFDAFGNGFIESDFYFKQSRNNENERIGFYEGFGITFDVSSEPKDRVYRVFKLKARN